MANVMGKEGFVRQQHAILERPDYSSMLKTVAVPTLVVVGENDELLRFLNRSSSIS